jgi:porin
MRILSGRLARSEKALFSRARGKPSQRAGRAIKWAMPRLVVALLATASVPADAQEVKRDAPMQELEAVPGIATQRPPLQLELSYGSDGQFLVSGGGKRGGDYVGRVGLIADGDLERLVGWSGAVAHLSIHEIHGEGLSAHRLGNLLTVSGLEAEPTLRLFNLWVEQVIGRKLSLRVGQFTAGQEFAIPKSGALFVNSSFGWPASFAVDLPSGGPAYPLAAPGVRVQYARHPGQIIRVALFAGDPAGPGSGDPQRRDRHGFNGFRLARPPYLIGEVQQHYGSTTITVGAWRHFADFADLRPDERRGPQAGPQTSSMPLEHRGDWGFYAIGDGRLWQSPLRAARSVTAFGRGTVSPTNRNLLDRYFDAGLVLTAPFRKRPDDAIGIAIAYAHVSNAARRLAGDADRFNGLSRPQGDHEAIAELSYQMVVANSAFLQPNIQYVLHPGGGAANTLGKRVPNALVIGLRTSIRLNILGGGQTEAR